MTLQSIAIIGLGLIGASLLRALKSLPAERSSSLYIKGYDPGIPQDEREELLHLGLDRFEERKQELYDADLIILAAPAATNITLLDEISRLAPKSTLVTDVSSTKSQIARRASELQLDFIGMHPMAGREQQGYKASQDGLLHDRPLVLCCKPELCMDGRAAELRSLLEAIGCRVFFMDPEEHDRMVASVSHLPQLLSTTLMNHCGKHIETAGPGFNAMTRLAGSPWVIWEDIIATNQENISTELKAFSRELETLAEEIEQGNLEHLAKAFSSANRLRHELNTRTVQ